MPKTLVIVVATLVWLSLTPAPPAVRTVTPIRPPAQAQARSGAVSSPPMRPEHAVRYWTAERQAAADAAAGPPDGSAGRRGAPPAATANLAGARRHSVPASKRLTPGSDANGYARVPRPYTRAATSRITGRLFFVNSGGHGDSCSASVVRSAAQQLVVTAAHCVYSVPAGATTGRWHRRFAFVPAYDGRAATVKKREPYGRWGGRRAWKPDGYTGLTGGDWNSVHDIALIEVGTRKRTLQKAVGAFTPMRSQGGRHTIATMGYPGVLGRRPYDGRDQLWCLGRTRQATGMVLGATLPASLPAALPAATTSRPGRLETHNCHLHKGHSGGPWLVQGTRDLVGVLSAGKEDGYAAGNAVANALNAEGYGAIVRQADPRGVYDALSVKLSGPDRPVRRGSDVTVTATVELRGLMAAARVPVTLTLPAGATLTATRGATCVREPAKASCTIAEIHPRRPVRITATIAVARDARAPLRVVGHVTSTALDPSQKDNTGTVRLKTRR
ncbi:trypsin-like serine peptidase [Nonomuraea sp. KM88]|uniref:trypsin-like serine peptidase n=1 Tax=Nonomuraea sp. KM88 TaxID=3457427 RepID=UPI003FCD89D8